LGKRVRASAKKIAIIAVFSALTIALNLSPLKFPAPYAPYLIYQVWEIPIVTAFLLYGFPTGVIIAALNTLVLLMVFPGMLLTGPLYNLAAVISMLIGVALPKMFHKNPRWSETTEVVIFTAFGIISRVVIMTLVNWSFLRFPPPVGFAMQEQAILLALPLIAFFNATLALYTVPLSYIIAEAIKRHIKV
jgi:riboflavin transporter FmnP